MLTICNLRHSLLLFDVFNLINVQFCYFVIFHYFSLIITFFSLFYG